MHTWASLRDFSILNYPVSGSMNYNINNCPFLSKYLIRYNRPEVEKLPSRLFRTHCSEHTHFITMTVGTYTKLIAYEKIQRKKNRFAEVHLSCGELTMLR